MADDRCSICGKSFRGWDPLTDGTGRYFHKKCAPKTDRKAMEAGIKKFFGDHGVEAIQIGRKIFKTGR